MQTWDQYASVRPQRRLVNAAGEKTWFNWTQYPDHGPGIEILSVGPGARVLDLGCGKGGNLAHVNAVGCRGVGVDISPVQIEMARERWGEMELHCADALSYLTKCAVTFDAIYSVFGAMWFVDPDLLLPVIRRRLSGVLAFSFTRMDAVEGIERWDLQPTQWASKLDEHGFVSISIDEIAAPTSARDATVLVRAKSPF